MKQTVSRAAHILNAKLLLNNPLSSSPISTFNSITQLADDIFESNAPSGASVSAVTSQLNETQPAIAYPVPEVSAIQRGRGRGGRGNRGRGRGRGSSQGGASGGAAPKHKGTKHPDLPAGEWSGCSMHFRWGRGAFFCAEPSTCPWKDIYSPKPAK